MANLRVYELAKQYNVDNKIVKQKYYNCSNIANTRKSLWPKDNDTRDKYVKK